MLGWPALNAVPKPGSQGLPRGLWIDVKEESAVTLLVQARMREWTWVLLITSQSFGEAPLGQEIGCSSQVPPPQLTVALATFQCLSCLALLLEDLARRTHSNGGNPRLGLGGMEAAGMGFRVRVCACVRVCVCACMCPELTGGLGASTSVIFFPPTSKGGS